jgi:hypothetical protein
MACSCSSSTTVRSCAPYANVNDVNNLLSAVCPNCTQTVPSGTDSSLFCSFFGGAMDDCCEFLIVFEGTNVWISSDCSIWINIALGTHEIGDVKQSARSNDNDNKWLLLDGRTIGSSLSNATHRNNADMLLLFLHLWDEFGNTELPIQDSTGTPVARGVDALTDWNANRRIPLPDLRGHIVAGMDDPGNGAGAAGRITNANADILGGSSGSENHTLTESEMPSHNHVQQIAGTSTTTGGIWTKVGSVNATADSAHTTKDTGGDQPHNNVQPTFYLNYFIYTGN